MIAAPTPTILAFAIWASMAWSMASTRPGAVGAGVPAAAVAERSALATVAMAVKDVSRFMADPMVGTSQAAGASRCNAQTSTTNIPAVGWLRGKQCMCFFADFLEQHTR